MHAVVLHQRREQTRGVDHPATDARRDAELQRTGELAARQRRATHSGHARDGQRRDAVTPGRGCDPLHLAPLRRVGDEGTHELSGSDLQIVVGGGDELIEHHPQDGGHDSGSGVGVGGCSVCCTSSRM